MQDGYAEQLEKLEAKVLMWKVLSISLTLILLVSIALLVLAGFIRNGDMAVIAVIIYVPLWASVPFIINHWHKLSVKKDALEHYVLNEDKWSKIYFQLIERYISGNIEQFFGKIGLTYAGAHPVWSGSNDPDLAVSARKNKHFIRAVFSETGFSLDVNEDEEEHGRVMIRYPGSNSLEELSELMNAEINKKINKNKNGKQ